ncbi:MAG: thiol-disulfide oxidoreductase DCC family protein [Flammeovirgaceae bacterium]|nr:thiol-disulfide oxidoreductase DCC family protein [Flammeovirgaceae bacterium]
MKHAIILFDGVCNLCNSSVNFIIERDKKRRYKFASLQSETGRKLLEKMGLPSNKLDSIVLIEDETVYFKSTAALKIASQLDGFWKIFGIFRLVPRPLRDAAYDLIAKNRYRWFGKKASCRIPTPELKTRFLDL